MPIQLSRLVAISGLALALLGGPALLRAADDGVENPAAKYIKPIVVDEYNTDVSDAQRKAPVAAKRGGSVKLRTKVNFGEMNPILSTGQPERMVLDPLSDSLADQDKETLEYYPKMAWYFEMADVLKEKGKPAQVGRILSMNDKEVKFVAGPWVKTYNRYDVESFDVAKGELKLKAEKGGATIKGKLKQLPSTIQVDEGASPEFAAKAKTYKVSDLDTWDDAMTGKAVARPFAKEMSAYRYHIREGIKWQDGQPVTGEDVKFSVETINNTNISEAAQLRNYYQDIDKCELSDKNMTVTFEFKRPYFAAIDFLSFIRGNRVIVPRHVFKPEQFGGDEKAFAEAFSKHPYRDKPMGMGPYRVKEFVQGQRFTIERNPDYWANKLPAGAIHKWEPNQPYLDEVSYVVIGENSASLVELIKGGVDGDMEVEQDQFVSEQTETPDFKNQLVKAKSPGFLYVYVGWNMLRPVLKQKEVRRALGMLIPREKILKDVHKGLGELVTGPWYVAGPGYDHDVPQLPYDPKAAKKLLNKAGWIDRDHDNILDKVIDGKKTNLEFEYLIHTAKEYHAKVADIMKESVEQVGARMTIKKLDWEIYSKNTRDKNFDAVRYAWGTNLEPDGFQQWHSSQMENKGDNFVSYKNTRVDELMVKIRETFDPTTRWEMAKEAHRIIAEDQPYSFLFSFENLMFYNRGLRNVKFYPSSYYYDVWEWYWDKPKAEGGKK